MVDVNKMDKRLLSYVNIFLLSNKLQTAMDKGMEELTGKQWLALTMLLNFREAPTLKQVAERMGVSHQSVRQIITQLERRGYVRVMPDEVDGRAIRIVRTEKADKLREKDTKRNWDFVFEFFSVLSEEEIGVYYNAQKKLLENLRDIEE